MEVFVYSFFGLTTLGYFIPSAIFHSMKELNQDKIIQKKSFPQNKDILREIKLSLSTITIWSSINVITFDMIEKGYFNLFFDITEETFLYNVLSFFMCFFIHDTYFYWTHRLMHHRSVYKYTHKGHHLSITPTAWAALAFYPGEAVLQYIQFSLIPFTIRIHIGIFIFYLVLDIIINTAGHCGYEHVSEKISKNKYLKYLNTVKHHDDHHSKFNVNYGAFFNFWDRICGTYYQ